MSVAADGVVVGWSFEDSPLNPKEYLAGLDLPAGIPVLVFTSFGRWRAGLRRRAFVRRDLVEVFGQQPDLSLRSVPMNAEGDGFIATSFRYAPELLGERDLTRVRATTTPRETLSVCYISRHVADDLFSRSLRSITPVADEVVCVVNGTNREGSPTRPLTADILERFASETGIPTKVIEGSAPRFCFDCQLEHPIGEMAWGHRFAGFETPRNQSLAAAQGDWILWLDTDEAVEGPTALHKYLRPNAFAGYSVSQHHHSVDPPNAGKIDLPVRLFRRKAGPEAAGWVTVGPQAWPTYHSGLTVRFAGIVHEHPGFAPDYTGGIGPVVVVSDSWIVHSGYFTEPTRRARFTRNWPLMVADHQKYPERRLTLFLWLRDLSHHLRYLLEQSRNQVTPEIVRLANACVELWRTYFVNAADAFTNDAHTYASLAMQVLQIGMEVRLQAEFWKPEINNDDKQAVQFAGRVENFEQAIGLLQARAAECGRFTGRYL